MKFHSVRVHGQLGSVAVLSVLCVVTVLLGVIQVPAVQAEPPALTVSLRGVSRDATLVGKVKISANVTGTKPDLVIFELSGLTISHTHAERVVPYLFGDKNGFDTRSLPDGDYTLTVTAVRAGRANGLVTMPVHISNGSPELTASQALEISVRGVQSGAVLNGRVNIEAIVSGGTPKIVTFTLNGSGVKHTHTERVPPYLFGNKKGFNTHAFPDGDYTLSITAIRAGLIPSLVTMPVHISNGTPEPVANRALEISVRGVQSGSVLNGRVNIEATVLGGTPEIVTFSLNGSGVNHTHTERVPPYLFGNKKGFDTRKIADGNYTLTVAASALGRMDSIVSMPIEIINRARPIASDPTVEMPNSKEILEPMDLAIRGINSGDHLSGTVQIEAVVTGGKPEAVMFAISGPEHLYEKTQQTSPYRIGNGNGFDTTTLANGAYVLNVTAIRTNKPPIDLSLLITIDNPQRKLDSEPEPVIENVSVQDIGQSEFTGPEIRVIDSTGNPNNLIVNWKALDIKVGQRSERAYFIIHNEGDQPLVIRQTTLSGDTSDFQYQVVNAEETIISADSFTIPSGSAYRMESWFSPTAPGNRSAQVRLMTNDANESAVELVLSGTGMAALSTEIEVAPNLESGTDSDPIIASIPDSFSLPDSVISPGDAPILISGDGFSDPTSNPTVIGSGVGSEAIAIARWNVVPNQIFTEKFEVGVVAFHVAGIDRIEFSANNGPWTSVNSMSLNPRTMVIEYWVKLTSEQFSDGQVEVRAIAYPRVGIPRVLDPLYLYSNGGGSLPTRTVHVSANASGPSDGSEFRPYGTIDQAVEDIQNAQGSLDGGTILLYAGDYVLVHGIDNANTVNRWLTFRPALGVDREEVRFVDSPTGGMGSAHVHLQGLTIQPRGQGSALKSRDGHLWVQECILIGKGINEVQNNASKQWAHEYWTETEVTKVQVAFLKDDLVRNCYAHQIGEDGFKNVEMIVNCKLDDMLNTLEGFHPDVWQNSRKNDNGKVKNKIIYGLTANNIIHSQGVKLSPCENSAFVNIDVNNVDGRSNPSGHAVFGASGVYANILIKDSKFVGKAWLRESKGFTATDFVFINCVFEKPSQWTLGNIDGVRYINMPPGKFD